MFCWTYGSLSQEYIGIWIFELLHGNCCLMSKKLQSMHIKTNCNPCINIVSIRLQLILLELLGLNEINCYENLK